jgi:hypothetical protein
MLQSKDRILEAALYYSEKLSFSVLPVGENKKPLVPWKEFQTRRATADDIQAWWKKWPAANVGIITGKISGVGVIDVDEECGFEELEKHLPDSLVFPTAKSARGGKHYYFKVNGKPIPTTARFLPGVDMRGDGGYIIAPPSVRKEGKYEWQDGLGMDDVEPPYLPDDFLKLAATASTRQNPTIPTVPDNSPDKSRHKMFTNGRRDEDLFHVANGLFRGGFPEHEVRQTIHMLALSCGFPATEAAAKVRSALERAERQERNLTEDVRSFVANANGTFCLQDIYNTYNLKERRDKQNASDVLRTLCKEKIIEKYGNKNGHYRKVDSCFETIDFINATDDEFELTLPLGINSLVRLQPKNIIVVAGTPNSGKTAFLLNIVKDNLEKHLIEYLSSEMGAQEMRSRLEKFGLPWSYWKKFMPKERSSNFADVINPNAVNIIDFLEVHEDFWIVGKYLKEIYDKLDNGVAIVALQKATGKEMGRGGVGTLEKPRLYLAMEGNKIAIVKAKNWRSENNPNGLERYFKLVQGCKFIEQTPWDIAK